MVTIRIRIYDYDYDYESVRNVLICCHSRMLVAGPRSPDACYRDDYDPIVAREQIQCF